MKLLRLKCVTSSRSPSLRVVTRLTLTGRRATLSVCIRTQGYNDRVFKLIEQWVTGESIGACAGGGLIRQSKGIGEMAFKLYAGFSLLSKKLSFICYCCNTDQCDLHCASATKTIGC